MIPMPGLIQKINEVMDTFKRLARQGGVGGAQMKDESHCEKLAYSRGYCQVFSI